MKQRPRNGDLFTANKINSRTLPSAALSEAEVAREGPRRASLGVGPNPAKNAVYLNWRLPEEIPAERVKLTIYNTQGVQLRAEYLSGSVGIEEINTSNWPSGLYIYQLRHEEIQLHSEKFEIQH